MRAKRGERAAWLVRQRTARDWSPAEIAHRLTIAGYRGRSGELREATVRGWEAPSRGGPPEEAVDYLERIFGSTAPTTTVAADDRLIATLDRIAVSLERLVRALPPL